MDFVLRMMDFVVRMMDFVVKMMDFVVKMMGFVVKMMDFVPALSQCQVATHVIHTSYMSYSRHICRCSCHGSPRPAIYHPDWTSQLLSPRRNGATRRPSVAPTPPFKSVIVNNCYFEHKRQYTTGTKQHKTSLKNSEKQWKTVQNSIETHLLERIVFKHLRQHAENLQHTASIRMVRRPLSNVHNPSFFSIKHIIFQSKSHSFGQRTTTPPWSPPVPIANRSPWFEKQQTFGLNSSPLYIPFPDLTKQNSSFFKGRIFIFYLTNESSYFTGRIFIFIIIRIFMFLSSESSCFYHQNLLHFYIKLTQAGRFHRPLFWPRTLATPIISRILVENRSKPNENPMKNECKTNKKWEIDHKSHLFEEGIPDVHRAIGARRAIQVWAQRMRCKPGDVTTMTFHHHLERHHFSGAIPHHTLSLHFR